MEPSRKPNGAAKLVGKILKLADLADYQEGAVVSRTIMSNKAGTATLFAFDEGQGLSEHTAPFEALVFLLEGEAQVVITGQISSLQKGEMIIMPAHAPHAVKATKRFKMLLMMIKDEKTE